MFAISLPYVLTGYDGRLGAVGGSGSRQTGEVLLLLLLLLLLRRATGSGQVLTGRGGLESGGGGGVAQS